MKSVFARPWRAALRCTAAGAAAASILNLTAIGGAAAQSAPRTNEAATLPEVSVTAPKAAPDPSLTQPGIDAARSRLDKVPGGANVVDADDYRMGNATTTADTFAYAPGVFAQSRIPGAEEARLSIRGSGIQRTFHGRGIKMLQDGVPLNQADGAFDFQAIEPLTARYIEVFRGANALQYGATTLGGAINYSSYSGYDAAPSLLRGEIGSFGYMRGQASLAGVKGATDYYVSLSGFEQDGYQDHSRQSNQRFFANLGFRINDSLETRVYFTVATTDSELPGSLNKAQLLNSPRQANPANVAGNHHRDFSFYRLANRTTLVRGEQRFEGTVYYSYKALWHPIFQVLDIQSDDYGIGLKYVNEATVAGRRNVFTVGFSPAWTRQGDDRFVNVAGTQGARTAQSSQTASNLDLYAENQHYATEQTALIVGVQATRASRAYVDMFLSNGNQGFNQRYDRVSPRFGVRHEFAPTAQVYANVSNSFEPPSFGELAGGPNVTPVSAQSARTLEIGSRGSSGNAQWDVALYHARVTNELLSLNAANGTPLGTVNAPDTVHRGLEFGAALTFARSYHLRGSYLWNDFRFDNHPVYGDNVLPGIPRHFLRAELLYRSPQGFFAGPNIEWSPDNYPVDMANSLVADAYAVFGLRMGLQVNKGVSWFVDARNLGDRAYAATTGVIADARGTNPAAFNPGIGRSVFAGIEWKQ